MKVDNIQTIYKKGQESILVSTRKIKVYQALLDTGAVIEQGVFFNRNFSIGEEELRLINEQEATNSEPLLPYIAFREVYCPTASKEETIDLYRAVKKYASINEELDVRQYESIKKRIDVFAFNMFYGKEHGSTSAKLKGATFFLWTLAASLNAMSDKAGLAALQYFCAALQIDYFQLVPMIMASTISTEKKRTILETIKSHYINPEAIEKGNKYIGLYTKIDSEDKEKILERIR